MTAPGNALTAASAITVTDQQAMIDRAHECANGFRSLRLDMAEAMTRGFARDMESGVPWPLYTHWLSEQEARLDSKRRTA